MTQDEIIAMAREAVSQITIQANGDVFYSFYGKELEAFAKLVAAKEREIQGAAFEKILESIRRSKRAEEREACARFLEHGVDLAGLAGDPVMAKYTVELLLGCAAAIRAREVPPTLAMTKSVRLRRSVAWRGERAAASSSIAVPRRPGVAAAKRPAAAPMSMTTTGRWNADEIRSAARGRSADPP